jgi:FeS assembly SUF system protein
MSENNDIKNESSVRPQFDPKPERDFLEGFLSKPDIDTGEVYSEDNQVADANPEISERVVEAIKGIFDPEIPVNIYDLGLIYNVSTDEDGVATIIMTLTTPHCPVAESMPGEVGQVAEGVEGVMRADVKLVWEPPWDPSRMSEAAQLELGFI